MSPTTGVTFRFPSSDRKGAVDTTAQVKEFHGELFMAAVGNCRQIARTVNICPDALLDDGMLDVTLLLGSATHQASGSVPLTVLWLSLDYDFSSFHVLSV